MNDSFEQAVLAQLADIKNDMTPGFANVLKFTRLTSKMMWSGLNL
jgi:hypothetical protein